MAESVVVMTNAEAAALGYLNLTTGTKLAYIATSATTTVTVRATTYTPQASNAQRSIKSTSANDTSAGTGARTVMITYLDITGAGPFTETLTMNGTTGVNTVNTNIAFLERIEVVTVGSGGSNAGTIQFMTTTAGGGSVWGSIAVSDNQTFWAHHYVPVNKTAYLLNMRTGTTANSGSSRIQVTNPTNTAIAQKEVSGALRHDKFSVDIYFPIPIKILGPALIFLNETPDAVAAQTVFSSFGYIEF